VIAILGKKRGMAKKKSGIALWNRNEQPRERLLAFGPHALTPN
jgi:hypothetical protein